MQFSDEAPCETLLPSPSPEPEVSIEEAVPMVSGILSTLHMIEEDVIHMTRSSSSRLELQDVPPPRIRSLAQDSLLSHDECFNELQAVQDQLMQTH